MQSFTYELKSPFKYTPRAGGEEVEANFIELSEPTGKVSHLCCLIESLIQTGILEMSSKIDMESVDTSQATESDGHTADSVLSIMMGADMSKVVIAFKELFRTVALVDGEKVMTLGMIERMSHKDFKQMMGEYAANFIMG